MPPSINNGGRNYELVVLDDHLSRSSSQKNMRARPVGRKRTTKKKAPRKKFPSFTEIGKEREKRKSEKNGSDISLLHAHITGTTVIIMREIVQ